MKILLLAVLLLAICQVYAAAEYNPATFIYEELPFDSKNSEISQLEAEAKTLLRNVHFEKRSASDTTTPTPTSYDWAVYGTAVSSDWLTPDVVYPMSSRDMAAISSVNSVIETIFPSFYFDEQKQASNGWITTAPASTSTHHGSSFTTKSKPHETGSGSDAGSVPAGLFSTGIAVATWTQCEGTPCSVGYAVYPASYPAWFEYKTCDPDAALITTMVPSPTATEKPVTIGPFDIAAAKDCYYSVDTELTCDSEEEATCAYCAGSGCEGNCFDDSWVIGGTCGW